MKFVLPVLLFLFSIQIFAASLKSRIHSIDVATKKGLSHLIMLENGSVVFLDYNQKDLLKAFQASFKQQEKLAVEVDSKNHFLGAETVEEDSPVLYSGGQIKRMTYDPSVISSAEASNAFYRMRRDYQNNSQCYNRAHIWVYEEYQRTGLKSTKHFLFFTRRYIRNYNYKWWFHVSPSVEVDELGSRILDRRYTSGTRSLNNWTRNFIYSGRTCPVVYNWYDYRSHQESEDCYLIPTSMYFWQPRDIERRDNGGSVKNSFYRSEVDYAYWEAF
jgi:hypothetical protein